MRIDSGLFELNFDMMLDNWTITWEAVEIQNSNELWGKKKNLFKLK